MARLLSTVIRSTAGLFTHRRFFTWLFAISAGLLIGFLLYLRQQEWVWSPWTGFRDKNLWDILELFIIPATITFVAMYLESLGKKAEQDIAVDNQREAALQNYFDSMTSLIIDKNLHDSQENANVRDIAQVKTITTLERLDIDRRMKVVRFLSEVHLINSRINDAPIITLDRICLEDASLKHVDLMHTSLRYAHLEHIDLSEANLEQAYLDHADLKNARLEFTKLDQAHLEETDLQASEMKCARLAGADLTNANLGHARLVRADLRGANLGNANLNHACLNRAELAGANLVGANLTGTTFTNANYDRSTIWPIGFDHRASGAIQM